MRNTHKLKMLFAAGLAAFSVSTFAGTTLLSDYKIVYQAPTPTWKLANQQQDAEGYTMQYQPKSVKTSFQSITLNYGKGIQVSLKDSMQQVVSEMNTTDCQRKESNILKQDDKTLVFSTLLDQCANGKTLTQVFKVFNMPDGQYSIVYSADAKSSSSSIQQMESMIESAKLVPAHQTT
jgi:hypothetical protein